ncbi:Lipase (class 3) [Seminavis robusta]|uniref:Lipase (Class 3) n=1 Tax=Seminavis robusta TaxID=568900 RepID=A0A9N8HLW7_9STRA|nr:Lipase (class 3) [Seminavis robusta]|eukprot:Sro858_g211900.1 Lipase (class 3) (1084) ;mRNA; f:36896-40559
MSAQQEGTVRFHQSTKTNRSRGVRSSMRSSIFSGSSVGPVVARYRDHFSLQAPTSVVKFQDSNSAARVIYNGNSQLVLEEKYDKEIKKRRVTIKQMSEEAGGSLFALRFTYTLVGAFFTGFLFVFSMHVIMFVVLDLAINAGLTDLSEASWPSALGVFLSMPVLVHSFALAMMLAGLFVQDLWKGHILFKKFVLPSQRDELIEWIFLLGMLIIPLCVIGGLLMSGTERWWELGSLVWFFCVFCFYLFFLISVLWYETRIFFHFVLESSVVSNRDSLLGVIWACIEMRGKHTWSGYSRTNYASFGSPDSSLTEESRKMVVEGTLIENQRSLYSRFSQWSALEGILYNKLETPRRLYSVDDVTARRPYITSYSWSLERYFCRPRKTRYIRILQGPGAVTSPQLKSAIVCSFIGALLIYFLLAALMVHNGSSAMNILAVLLVMAIVSLPLIFAPIKSYNELRKLRLLKRRHRAMVKESQVVRLVTIEEDEPEHADTHAGDTHKHSTPSEPIGEEVVDLPYEHGTIRVRRITMDGIESNNSEVEHVLSTDDDKALGSEPPANNVDSVPDVEKNIVEPEVSAPKRSVRISEDNIDEFHASNSTVGFGTSLGLLWSGFETEDEISMGVFFVAERYRITSPTPAFSGFIFFSALLLLVIYPTISLYLIESWQLATFYLAIAIGMFLRHHTNASLLLQETGMVNPPEEGSDPIKVWENQSRLSQVAATVSRGKSYYAWRFVFAIFAVVVILLGIQAQGTSLDNTETEYFTVRRGFYYEEQKTLHYTSCEFDKDIEGNPQSTLIDYMFLSALAYRTPNETAFNLRSWYGPGVVEERVDIVDSFRATNQDNTPVFYKLFTASLPGNRTHAIISIRGTHNPWDMFADGQLWGAAVLLQLVRAVLPFGYIFDPILHHMVTISSFLQSGSLDKMSFYRSTTDFANHLTSSSNFSSVLLTGHSLGGGLAIISGAQAELQAVAVSGPNAKISRNRLNVTVENLERYTFNIKPDRDPVAMVDDPTKNLQQIECTAPHNELFACHNIRRSLCEGMYTCGTKGRPVVCECATLFGYPEPKALDNNTISFAEACTGARVVVP